MSNKHDNPTNFGFKKIWYLGFVLIIMMISVSYAEITIPNSPLCMDLLAGQDTDAGNVCVEMDNNNLNITYTTTGVWELTEVHFWIGSNLAGMPQTNKGNPKVGHFPYHSDDITGDKVYFFSIPVQELGGEDALCNQTLVAAAHAELRFQADDGSYHTESAWADGERIVKKGNWATYFEVSFECEGPQPPPLDCESGFVFGDKELWDILDSMGNPITDSWGWQNTVYAGDRIYQPIYIGAVDNNPGTGTYVGEAYISFSGTYLIVELYTILPYSMSKTHLYVGTAEANTGDPDGFPYSHTLAIGDRTDHYTIPISSGQIYVVVHLNVCQPSS